MLYCAHCKDSTDAPMNKFLIMPTPDLDAIIHFVEANPVQNFGDMQVTFLAYLFLTTSDHFTCKFFVP